MHASLHNRVTDRQTERERERERDRERERERETVVFQNTTVTNYYSRKSAFACRKN